MSITCQQQIETQDGVFSSWQELLEVAEHDLVIAEEKCRRLKRNVEEIREQVSGGAPWPLIQHSTPATRN
jgi:hypothetical protein